MAKPEWGVKRTCQNCGARFYDLKREPIVCPKCETVFDPLANLRPRRSRLPVGAESPSKPPAAPVAEDAKPGDEVETALVGDEIAGIEEDEEGVIEDASELGEDDDGVSDVGIDEEDEP